MKESKGVRRNFSRGGGGVVGFLGRLKIKKFCRQFFFAELSENTMTLFFEKIFPSNLVILAPKALSEKF